MELETSPFTERGLLTLSDKAWELARRRMQVIAPLAALDTVGHQAADDGSQQLGLSRRQVYVLVRRYRQGAGLLTDLAPGQSSGGKGKGRLLESVERIIRELLHKRFLTRQKRSLGGCPRIRLSIEPP
jgi:putative transposase